MVGKPIADRATAGTNARRKSPGRPVGAIVLVVLVAALPTAFSFIDVHLRAAGLLVRFEGDQPSGALGWLASYREAEVEVREVTGPVGRLKWYLPHGEMVGLPAVLLVHGVHPEGIDESRLTRFAETIARSGVVVATPEIHQLTQYDLSVDAVERIQVTAKEVARITGQDDVGVIGISFSGGLALLAALDSTVPIRFVVSLGGHHNLTRVLDWYLGSRAIGPSGTSLDVSPHPYGIGVFLYAHARRLFAPVDVETARAILRELLAGHRGAAQRLRAQAVLSEAGAVRIDLMFAYLAGTTDEVQVRSLKNEVRNVIRSESERFSRLSPAGQLASLGRDVFIIHGLTDPIVPSTEAKWLARDLPEKRRRSVLITDVIRHAEYGRDPAIKERWAMVRTMADILRAAQ